MTDQTSVPGLVARDVCKSFGSHLVLDHVNLTAAEGSILALLGPNGAGKTTMVRILSTLISADSGSMCIAGHDVVTDPDGVRAQIGVLMRTGVAHFFVILRPSRFRVTQG